MKEKLSRLFVKNLTQKTFDNPTFCLKLDIDIPLEQIEKEICSIPDELFVAHRDDNYEDNRGWRSFVLHGKDQTASREDGYYNDERSMDWTAAALQYCPQTVEYFKTQWPCNEFYRVRVMLLEPNGIINLHQDPVDGELVYPVNIAITQPEECKFYLDNYGVVPFEPGTAYMIDISKLHTVINDSNKRRYHLIVHHKKLTKEFDLLIKKSYNSKYASDANN